MSGIIDGIGGNNEMYCGMSDVEVSELKASMEDILKKNPFGLVYNKALTDNVPGKINSHGDDAGLREVGGAAREHDVEASLIVDTT